MHQPKLTYRDQMLSRTPFVLALGLFLTVCGTLRVIDGLGIGELLLLMLGGLGFIIGPRVALFKSTFAWFWALLAVSMSLGFLFGQRRGIWVERDALAYVYTGFVSLGLLLLIRRWTDTQIRSALKWLFLITLSVLWFGFIVFLYGDAHWIHVLGMDDHGSRRYTAWSTNANQLALFFVPLPIWVVLARSIRQSKAALVLWFFTLIATLLMGFVVRSDALVLSWVLGLIVLLVLNVIWKNQRASRFLAALVVVFLILFMLAKIFASGDVRKTFHCSWNAVVEIQSPIAAGCVSRNAFSGLDFFRNGYSSADRKTDIRRTLWSNALEVVSEAPFVGNGPGAFSWVANSLLMATPNASGNTPMEAHNITLDLMTQGGVLLGLAWLALLGRLLWLAYVSRCAYAFTWVLMMGVFTMFMYHLRHPYLWFALILAEESIRRRLWCSGNSSA